MNEKQAVFEEIFALAKARLPRNVEARSQKGAKGGGALLMIHDEHWCDASRMVTIHLKFTASNRIALHVETFPYQNSDPVALENKNTLLKNVRKALFGFSFEGYKELAPRNGWGTHDSSAVGYVKIDPDHVSYSAGVLAKLYEALEPSIDAQFETQK